MKKFIFFCGIWNYLLFNLNGSQVDGELSNIDDFPEAYTDQQGNGENSLIEVFLKHVNLLINMETNEFKRDINIWFSAQIDTLLHLDDSEEYEICKEALREDLEWYEVIYGDLPMINLIKNFIES